MGTSSGERITSSREPQLQVLHEDNHVIAVLKPFGLLTQGDLTGDESLLDLTKVWLKQTHQKPGNVYLGLVHRLDRPVAGIVLFAKTSKAAGRLSESFRERRVRKVYRALVQGSPTFEETELEHYLSEGKFRKSTSPESNRVSVRTTTAPGFKVARLRVKVVQRLGRNALLEVELETGRKHQIRAQLAAVGHPIFADRKYGGPELPPGHPLVRARGIALVASRLEVPHPVQRDHTLVLAVPEALDPLHQLFDR